VKCLLHQGCDHLALLASPTSGTVTALFNPRKSILIQKCHPYTGNLNSETLGDSKNAFLHWGNALGLKLK